MNRTSLSLLATIAAVGAAGLTALPAVADEASLEEIVVTARKRAETVQDVPFSVSVQTGDALRDLGANSLEDVANTMAGFSLQSLGPGQSQPAIRGVSAGQIVRDLPGVKEQVGVYLDESVISLSLYTPELDLVDLDRVEVLRGPQGTLFGSGSLAGTVRYITRQPDFSGFDAYVETSPTITEDGESAGNVKGVINVPLSETLALRAVGYGNRLGGFVDAVQPDGGVAKDVNDGRRAGGRIALAYRPNDRLSITPRLVYQDIDVGGFNRTDEFNILANPFTTTRPAVSLGEREQFTQLEERLDDEFLLFDTTVTYDFGNHTLTSISSYSDRDLLVRRDATALYASIAAQPDILGQPEAVFTLDAPLDDTTQVETITQELRVANNATDGVQWVAGLFFSDMQRDYGQHLLVDGFEALTGIDTNPAVGAGNQANLHGEDVLFFSSIPYDFRQAAVFGEATLPLSDRLDLTLGARYFDFEEERVLNFDGIFAAETIGQAGRTSSSGISPRAMLRYDLNEDTQLNMQVAKGFRLGGINDPLNEPLCSQEDLATFGGRDSFKDEELWNYEIGAKTRFAGGRATLNAALFYSDITDLQAPLDAGTCTSRIVFNVPEAHAAGIDLEFAMQATDRMSFGVAASLLEAEFDSTVTSTDVNGNTTPVGGIIDGNRLPTAPKFQLAAHAAYTWNAFGDWQAFAVGSLQHVGKRYTQPVDQAAGFDTVDLSITPIGDPSVDSFTFDPELPSYEIVNTRVGFRNDKYELALFVNNVTDEVAKLSLDRERGGRARVGFHTNQPRTFGVTARVNF